MMIPFVKEQEIETDDFFMGGGGGLPGLDDDDEDDNNTADQRQTRLDVMKEQFFTIDDLRLFFADLIHNPDDYQDLYAYQDLAEQSLVNQLLDRCKLSRPDDYEAYKANLDQLMLAKMTQQLEKYAIEDYPLKLSRIQARLRNISN